MLGMTSAVRKDYAAIKVVSRADLNHRRPVGDRLMHVLLGLAEEDHRGKAAREAARSIISTLFGRFAQPDTSQEMAELSYDDIERAVDRTAILGVQRVEMPAYLRVFLGRTQTMPEASSDVLAAGRRRLYVGAGPTRRLPERRLAHTTAYGGWDHLAYLRDHAQDGKTRMLARSLVTKALTGRMSLEDHACVENMITDEIEDLVSSVLHSMS